MLKNIFYGIGIILTLLLIVFLVIFYRIARQSDDIVNAGLVNELLQACPDRPSCVSSLATSDEHSISAFIVPQGMNDPVSAMADIIVDLPRTEILQHDVSYLHATFKSAVFGFVDDLEIVQDGELLQVRSVSRVGFSDMGVNRSRVNALQQLWQEAAIQN